MIGTIARVSGRLTLGQVRGGTCKKEGIRVLSIYLLLTPGVSYLPTAYPVRSALLKPR